MRIDGDQYLFTIGPTEYVLSQAGWDVLRAAAAALSQPGVRDEGDERVRLYLEQHLPYGVLGSLTDMDRQHLRGLGYGFALGSA